MDWLKIKAALFDLDGVLTPTTDLHMKAWSKMFNDYLTGLAKNQENTMRPYTSEDYFAYVDGKPRYDGVRSFLESRGLKPNEQTIAQLGDRKNKDFMALLATEGIEPYPGSLKLIQYLKSINIEMCVVSSSKNAQQVLQAAKIRQFFSHVVDGNLANSLQLNGKPAPDTYSYAAKLCGLKNQQAAVFEDAISGVQAGVAGHFKMVVAVNRGVGVQALKQAGAMLVVDDLKELLA